MIKNQGGGMFHLYTQRSFISEWMYILSGDSDKQYKFCIKIIFCMTKAKLEIRKSKNKDKQITFSFKQ